MEINFDKDYLRQLYEEGKTTDKKHRFQPNIVARYQLRIKVLEQARSVEELYVIHSLHYEVLKGDKAGISSIRVNDQYRIEFTVEQVSSETVVTICNILELSNHGKIHLSTPYTSGRTAEGRDRRTQALAAQIGRADGHLLQGIE